MACERICRCARRLPDIISIPSCIRLLKKKAARVVLQAAQPPTRRLYRKNIVFALSRALASEYVRVKAHG